MSLLAGEMWRSAWERWRSASAPLGSNSRHLCPPPGCAMPGHFPLIAGSLLPCCQSPGQGSFEQGQVLSHISTHSAELLLPGELSPQHVPAAQPERDELFQPARSMRTRLCSSPSSSSGFICPLKVPGVYHRTRDKDKKTKSSSHDDTADVSYSNQWDIALQVTLLQLAGCWGECSERGKAPPAQYQLHVPTIHQEALRRGNNPL